MEILKITHSKDWDGMFFVTRINNIYHETKRTNLQRWIEIKANIEELLESEKANDEKITLKEFYRKYPGTLDFSYTTATRYMKVKEDTEETNIREVRTEKKEVVLFHNEKLDNLKDSCTSATVKKEKVNREIMTGIKKITYTDKDLIFNIDGPTLEVIGKKEALNQFKMKIAKARLLKR